MTTFMNFSNEENPTQTKQGFDLQSSLKNNGWRSNVNPSQAEEILAGKPVYTYLIRPNIEGRGFSISFVQPNGQVKHDHFKLVDPIYGIWRNGMIHHVGKLEKVICDMMECTPFDLKPL